MKLKLSINMMVKNEERNLERCLNSLQELRRLVPSELIIVDTGSTDNTVDIAKKYTDQVYFHPWENDFSAMRNTTIGYAKGEWILIMDADEELTEVQPIVNFLNSPDRKRFGAVAIDGKNFTDSNDQNSFSMMMTLHLFKNDGYFHYEGAVHNQPVFKGEAYYLPVTLHHYGYLADDPVLMERKFQRTSGILKSELEKDPENMYYWYQLSVSYGMHNDIALAVDAIEKAYRLYKKQKTELSMYIYTHMAMMYQMAREFDKVEAICEESLQVKEGYIDICYFLAEAKTALGKKAEGIKYYEKYFRMVDELEPREHDLAVPEYAMAHQNMAAYNMVQLYRTEQRYADSLMIARRITDRKLVREILQSIIFAYGKLQKFKELRAYYDEEWQDEEDFFFETLEKMTYEFFQSEKADIAHQFCDIKHFYGLLCKIIVQKETGRFSVDLVNQIDAMKLAEMPVFCSEIFYYLLEVKYPLEKCFENFKETWFVPVFKYVSGRHAHLGQVIFEYFAAYDFENNFEKSKLTKMFCRFALLLDHLPETSYQELFNKYIQAGTFCLQTIYNSLVIDNELTYELKNDEETFLLYMTQALKYKEVQSEYVRYLRLALQAMPQMKRGIEMLLNDVIKADINPMEELLDELMVQLQDMIQQGQYSEAERVITESEAIVGKNSRLLTLKAQLFLKTQPGSFLQ
ncbi:MAG: glycosyltransferase family 2 protein [Sporomusaceae bacterium]|nr:glycosyltransferase family 2 protein [Sporomusaceae bacterium]